MKKCIVIFVLFSCFISKAQDNTVNVMIDSLGQTPFLYSDALDCHADLYWRIIAKGKKALPYLINHLTDSTPTRIMFHCKSERLTIGEVCYFGINEIGEFPVADITGMQFDLITKDQKGLSCWNFYDFFFYNPNKVIYQQKIKKWYETMQSHYNQTKIANKDLTPCQISYGIKTYFKLIK